jgi:carbonic anhydrase
VENDKEFILRQINISKQLHGIKKVILMNHTDCGAYGGRAAFPDRHAERAGHRTDMEEAKKLILSFYPDLEVETVLVDIEEDGSINFAKAA